MKIVLFSIFGLFFGFFDIYIFMFCFIFLLGFAFFNLGSYTFMGLFFCDWISFFLFFLTVLVLFFCLVSSSLDSWKGNSFPGFHFCLFLIFFLLVLSFFCLNVFIFYICFEWIFMVMFFFVVGWGYSPERLQASFYMVFYTIVVSFPFLVYIVCFEEGLKSMKFLVNLSFSSYWWFFLFLVFFVKLPVYGVHLWLPKAHVEAPISGSMVLAGVLLKLGGYGLLRFSSLASGALASSGGYFLSMGLLGGLISCFLCLRQVDLKAFVAYSSICHMGFFLGGFYSHSFAGVMGGVFMLIAHGFCSSCLFYLLYIFYERFHTRSLFMVKGVGVIFPILMVFWFLFSVLNIGVPPSFSFFSEILILTGLMEMSFSSSLFCLLFLFFAGLYGIFFYTVVNHGVLLSEMKTNSMSMRESLICLGHLFPLIFISFFLNFFCF